MVKILGVGDILVALLVLATAFRVDVSLGLVIILSAYLFFKALIFIRDIASIFDIAVVILIISSFFISPPQEIFFFAAAFLGLKGMMSLFA